MANKKESLPFEKVKETANSMVQDEKTLEFIERAKKVHGDTYDYSKVQYKNAIKKVIIICKKHGEFLQTPSNHYNGSNCPKCTGNHKYSFNEFLELAKEIHGDFYEYFKKDYVSFTKKTKIYCKKHGFFYQSPMCHVKLKQKCRKCSTEINAKQKSHSLKTFIDKANHIHNNKYDYSLVEYNNSKSKIKIICKVHGQFIQLAESHLAGRNCPKCYARNKKLTTKEFIERAKLIHGEKFDYSKSIYKKTDEKLIIICQIHGEFLQTPHSHLGVEKTGCPKCAGKYMNTEDFIKKAILKHGNLYDYSKVHYVNANTMVEISCSIHGIFKQKACQHLSKNGCPKCANKHINNEEFILKAKKIHGDKYDYSKLNYTKTDSGVIIICKNHGEFNMKPTSHLVGNGCKECSRERRCLPKKYNTPEFINQANLKFNNKYDYSKTEITNYKKSIIICCPIHGEFRQKPMLHLNSKFGCVKCAGREILDTKEFIRKSLEIHNNKYDYSKVKCQKGSDEIIIICKEHGEFITTPTAHIHRKVGCQKCKNPGSLRFLNQEQFIEKCNIKHDYKYDYSKTIFNGHGKSLITIICSIHGEFTQGAYEHYKGAGCRKCKGFFTKEEFIIMANLKHDNRYDYSCTNYSTQKKIEINCKIHGQFSLMAKRHIFGSGCPDCDFIVKCNNIHGNIYDYSKLKFTSWNNKIKILCKIHGEFEQVAGTHITGSGCMLCNKGFSKIHVCEFLKSLPLELLSSHELLLLIKQSGAFNKLNQSQNFKKLLEANEKQKKKEIAEVLISEFEQIQDKIDTFINEVESFTTTELKSNDSEITILKDDKSNIDFESELTSQEFFDGIKIFDESVHTMQMPEDTIKFLIRNRVNGLWNRYMNGEIEVLQQIKQMSGNEYFNQIKSVFLNQVDAVESMILPNGYNFYKNEELIQPNLMQKLTIHLLNIDKVLINYSGVGSGKSLSGLLSSRKLELKNTLLISNNSTVDEWKEKILDYFPDTTVHTKGKYESIILDNTKWNVVVLNYEIFQQKNSASKLFKLIKNNNFHFVIMDEIQNAKQSVDITIDKDKIQNGLIRRSNIEATLFEIRQKNPDLYVLGMSATPVITNLIEGKKLLELVTGNKFDELKTTPTIDNALSVHMQLVNHGVRYLPQYKISIEEEHLEIDGRPILRDIVAVRKGGVLDMEEVLLDLKLQSIKSRLRPGIMLYSQYTGENQLVSKIKSFVESQGFSCGVYTGDDKTGKHDFVNKKVDVLIGSSSVNTGLDGIQKVCDQIIIMSLPWTYAQFEQLCGRIYRQGSSFSHIKITIVKVQIKLSEERVWSYDADRWNRISNRRTLADAAVDGIIPKEKIGMTPEQLLNRGKEALNTWIKEIENGYKDLNFERKQIILPLSPIQVDFVKKKFNMGTFSEINKEWSIKNSDNIHKSLQQNPEQWFTYHTLYHEARKLWPEIPYRKIAQKIKRIDWLIADMGCGENLLRLELPINKIEAFDHIAIDDSVVSCDISKLPVENERYDAVVLSLSLMGSNYKDYIKEAYRVLKYDQRLYVAEPIKKWENKIEELVRVLENIGFKCLEPEIGQKFFYVEGVKK